MKSSLYNNNNRHAVAPLFDLSIKIVLLHYTRHTYGHGKETENSSGNVHFKQVPISKWLVCVCVRTRTESNDICGQRGPKVIEITDLLLAFLPFASTRILDTRVCSNNNDNNNSAYLYAPQFAYALPFTSIESS